jgi:hypothetical protein
MASVSINGEQPAKPRKRRSASDRNETAAFLVSSASGAAVPVSEPYEPETVSELLSDELFAQVAKARSDAKVA